MMCSSSPSQEAEQDCTSDLSIPVMHSVQIMGSIVQQLWGSSYGI